jgi:hypothetical protein
MDRDNTNGRMEICSKENLNMGLNKVLEFGDQGKELKSVSMKENTIWTKSMELVFLSGQVETLIEELFVMMKDMDVVR